MLDNAAADDQPTTTQTVVGSRPSGDVSTVASVVASVGSLAQSQIALVLQALRERNLPTINVEEDVVLQYQVVNNRPRYKKQGAQILRGYVVNVNLNLRYRQFEIPAAVADFTGASVEELAARVPPVGADYAPDGRSHIRGAHPNYKKPYRDIRDGYRLEQPPTGLERTPQSYANNRTRPAIMDEDIMWYDLNYCIDHNKYEYHMLDEFLQHERVEEQRGHFCTGDGWRNTYKNAGRPASSKELNTFTRHSAGMPNKWGGLPRAGKNTSSTGWCLPADVFDHFNSLRMHIFWERCIRLNDIYSVMKSAIAARPGCSRWQLAGRRPKGSGRHVKWEVFLIRSGYSGYIGIPMTTMQCGLTDQCVRDFPCLYHRTKLVNVLSVLLYGITPPTQNRFVGQDRDQVLATAIPNHHKDA